MHESVDNQEPRQPDRKRREVLRRRLGATTPRLRGHQLVAKTLTACGVTHVYGVPGVPVDESFGACAREGLRAIGTRHQQAAVFAALAHNYVGGSPRAVVLVSSGPAVTNCATLLAGEDVVVVAGARLDWTLRFGSEIPSDAQVIHVDIDPAEAANTLGRGIGLAADASAALNALVKYLQAHGAVEFEEGWPERLAPQRALWLERKRNLGEEDSAPLSPYRWAREIDKAVPQNTVTILDGNLCMRAAESQWVGEVPVILLTPGTNGCMGVGIPFAPGAKLAQPDRPVVAICGGFAAGISLLELETAARHGVPIVIVLANNGGNGGSVRQTSFFPEGYPEWVSRFRDGIRYDLIAEALGGVGFRAGHADEINSTVIKAVHCPAPALIDVYTDPGLPMEPA